MSRDAIFEASVDFFLTPIRPFLEDDTVSEVMVNGYSEIYIERRGRLERTDASFPSHDALLSAIHNVAQFVNREIDSDRPIMDARLPNGSRVHVVLPPSARRGIYRAHLPSPEVATQTKSELQQTEDSDFDDEVDDSFEEEPTPNDTF